jgi:hypothetical protein
MAIENLHIHLIFEFLKFCINSWQNFGPHNKKKADTYLPFGSEFKSESIIRSHLSELKTK